MKQLMYLICFAAFALFATACSEDEEDCVHSKVDEAGLTQGIRDLIPQAILDSMLALGTPIYGGENPPLLEGTYLASPFVLESSNRPQDYVGMMFSDYNVTFYNQNQGNLSIMLDYVNGIESGDGLGSFIVGEGNKFSVFVEINGMRTDGSKAKLIHVISGKLVENGIEDLYCANFMIDNYGNTPAWIENGEGRVVYDKDGFSEKL